MDFNGGGYTPPENNFNNGSYRPTTFRMPQFVPHDVWLREKQRLKKLSTLAGGAVLLFVLLSSVYSGIYMMIKKTVETVGGQTYENFNRVISTSEFEFVFEMLYSVFVVGGPFFLLGYIAYKKGLMSSVPMGKPLKAKYLPIVIVAGFGLCLFGNVINSYFMLIFQMLTGSELDYSIASKIPETVPGIVLFYLGTAVVPALIEELALRGVIMQPLRRYGDWFAIICSALVFSLMHCNLVQIPFAFIAGVVIGYAVIITESIWTGVIIHFLTNGFSITVNILYEFYGMDSWQYRLCNIVFYAIIVIGAVLAYIVIKRFKDKPMQASPLVNQGKNIYGQVHPYSAKVSNKHLYGSYLLTPPMIVAFLVVCYETVVLLMYM